MFKKVNVPKVIPVAILVNTVEEGEDGEVTESSETVVHYFKRPTVAARENLGEILSKGSTKGKKALAATYHFWAQHIIKVEGYEDLLEVPKGNNEWDGYFKDEIGREHVNSMIIMLLRKLGGEETEVVKKSDSLQEES